MQQTTIQKTPTAPSATTTPTAPSPFVVTLPPGGVPVTANQLRGYRERLRELTNKNWSLGLRTATFEFVPVPGENGDP